MTYGAEWAERPAAVSRQPADSPWWSDALHDPWRDPATETAIVVPAPPPEAPTEPVAHPADVARGGPGRTMVIVLVTAVLAGVLAGALGGLLGYTYGSRGAGGTVLGAGTGNSPAALTQRHPESMAGAVDRVLPSVVTIQSATGGGSNLGSGFVVSADGHVITNDHVVGDSAPPTMTFHDGSTAPAALVGRDPESDVAVLKVDRAGLTPVRFGDSDAVVVGDPVLAVGSPLALANTVTSGIVSAVDRTIRAGEPDGQVRYYAAIQTDAAINQGNSGGPLVDAAGRVVGINSVIRSVAVSGGEAANIGLGFAIPISQAKRVATELIDTGRARRTVIGAELDPTPAGGSGGIMLADVVADGPADQAGLRPGDVLVRLDGRRLAEPTDLIALVRKHPPGSVITVEFRRGSSRTQATVTLVADAD